MARFKKVDKRKEENKAKFSDIAIGEYYEDVDSITYLRTGVFNVFDVDNNDERVIDESDIDKMITPLEATLVIRSIK